MPGKKRQTHYAEKKNNVKISFVKGCNLFYEIVHCPKPHKNYWKIFNQLRKKYKIKGVAHLTGGGFLENIPV